MATTREELEARIEALENAGLDASGERAQLAAIEAPKRAAKASAPAPAGEDFIPLNTESYETGGGGWTPPVTIGVKDAVCEGYMIPDFLEDQLWFIFKNPEYPEGKEPFRGAYVCGAISKPPGKGGGGAFKVKDIAVALDIQNTLKVVEGKGVSGLRACENRDCRVLWDYPTIKGKTSEVMRIVDVMAASAEPVM